MSWSPSADPVAVPGPHCARRTWTETSEHLGSQVVQTVRAGMEACRRVGELARPVTEFGVCWWTIFRHHSTIYATALVDLKARRVIDMVEGNLAADLRRWAGNADR